MIPDKLRRPGVLEIEWAGLEQWLRTLDIDRFKRAVAEATGAAHAIAVCNCTVALHLALHVLGLGPGNKTVTTGEGGMICCIYRWLN